LKLFPVQEKSFDCFTTVAMGIDAAVVGVSENVTTNEWPGRIEALFVLVRRIIAGFVLANVADHPDGTPMFVTALEGRLPIVSSAEPNGWLLFALLASVVVIVVVAPT